MHIALKTFGWILIALQILSLYGTSMGGGMHLSGGLFGLFELVGYFLFGIVGILLIIAGNKLKVRKKAADDEDTDPDSSAGEDDLTK